MLNSVAKMALETIIKMNILDESCVSLHQYECTMKRLGFIVTEKEIDTYLRHKEIVGMSLNSLQDARKSLLRASEHYNEHSSDEVSSSEYKRKLSDTKKIIEHIDMYIEKHLK